MKVYSMDMICLMPRGFQRQTRHEMSLANDGKVPVQIYQKKTDPNNTAIFAIVKVDGVDIVSYVLVQLTA
jgi:hypothetical protein